MKRCIVNVAVGSWYPQGQDRLVRTLREQGYRGDILLWRDKLPRGSPAHEVDAAPYAFKYWALKEAQDAGYDAAVWCDASVYFVGWPDALFGATICRGVWVTNTGRYVGRWTSDAALEKVGVSRASVADLPMVAATCFGLNFRHTDHGRVLLDGMMQMALDGVFAGKWSNNLAGDVSSDPKVMGHRHDQSAMSVLETYASLPRDGRRRLFCYESDWSKRHSVAVAAGM